jgi:hypothetical protein
VDYVRQSPFHLPQEIVGNACDLPFGGVVELFIIPIRRGWSTVIRAPVLKMQRRFGCPGELIRQPQSPSQPSAS